MSRQTIGVILMIGIAAGIVLMGMSLFKGNDVEHNIVVERNITKTCNHDWDVVADNGEIYCLKCRIEEVLR